MQEPTTLSPLLITPGSLPAPPKETLAFPSDFDSILFWDGAVPAVTTPYNIDSVKATRNAYEKLVEIALSAQVQIKSSFQGSRPNVRNGLEKQIASAIDTQQSGTLEAAVKKKAIIVELLQRVRLNKSWSEAEEFFGIDALSLDSTESSDLFAASVDTEDFEGVSRSLYEGFLRSLTAAYVKRILIEAISILEDASKAADAAIHSALARGEAAYTFRLPISQSAQLGTVVGAITLHTANGWTFEAAIHKGIQLLTGLGDALLSRATAVGIGALFYSPSLGNGERYPQTALSLPGRTFMPELPSNLNEIAAAEGTIDLPYRIYGDLSQYTLVATPAEGRISEKVPVRVLAFDPTISSYSFTSNDTPPITLSFPIIRPGSSSTTSPARPAEVPIYTGITLTPLLVQPETLPAVELPDFRDCIYCFPSESGLPPIYVVFNSPYEGATTRGKYSGRLFNPAKAGGQILDLEWSSATVTQAGIDLVKLHTGRFSPSDGNAIMIERLEKILRGELAIMAIDKRFYTHELRELERFRAVGVADGVYPNDEGVIWNNTHSATLEDYKLKGDFELLYTPDAIAADEKQREKEYKQIGGIKR
ncbi:S-type Pyocin [Pseudomonas sp. FW300-N1A1]|uniref:S-type pyocin domain-containing protein n=1 Tax=Pseudomonas sp. FW300-N1A1 TaxID=2075555 RepID=UPI000CD2D065|nr:S-type pyocin domain-containing protein [Pseudomonas sp. FW300-N1A1]POA17867.1 S-type Pyocin [Pseudomonas sp. FW300-N1A1]